MKKKFRETEGLSKEQLNDAILQAYRHAMEEQYCSLDHIITTAVEKAVDHILPPNIADISV